VSLVRSDDADLAAPGARALGRRNLLTLRFYRLVGGLSDAANDCSLDPGCMYT
jgi:hypothetical protein